MKTNTCMNFAKRVVMMLAVVLIAGSAWAGKYTYDFTKVSTSYWTTDNGTTAVTATNVDGFYYMQSGYSGHHFTTGTGTSSTHNHRFNTTSNSEYFFLGKTGEYLTLPSYNGEQVTSITIKKGGGGSASAKVNIYAGDNAASDESTISTGGTDFSIASAYQQSALRIQVTNEYNTSFAQIVINTTTACDKSVTIATNGTCSNASIK
ncbi:MAG: hypothetical protein IJ672_10220, partial [Methanobrevibacter sp.]|nr:hypothetical protein [Methanobrevibacter sp.]